jgi:DNA-binding CsgD family transcriptional regulator
MHESELMRLLEGTADAAFAVDLEGRIQTWNKAAERMFGCDASSALQRPCAALVNGRSANGAQVCRHGCFTLECARANLSDQSGRAKGGNIANFDMEARPRGRPSFWVNVSLLLAVDPHTERRLAVHFVREIENRKRAEHFTAEVLSLAHRLESSKDGGELPPTPSLTVQEQKVLELLRDGNGTEDVARKLEIGIGTLRNHLHHLNRKLGTHSRLEAVMQALKRGLI